VEEESLRQAYREGLNFARPTSRISNVKWRWFENPGTVTSWLHGLLGFGSQSLIDSRSWDKEIWIIGIFLMAYDWTWETFEPLIVCSCLEKLAKLCALGWMWRLNLELVYD
jgi:hypothetical protein